jgi:hypothetical protein
MCNHVLCCIQQANVGDRVKEPQFIRALMTAICLSAIESKFSCNISSYTDTTQPGIKDT